jgi:hypothetical protein
MARMWPNGRAQPQLEAAAPSKWDCAWDTALSENRPDPAVGCSEGWAALRLNQIAYSITSNHWETVQELRWVE